MDREPVGIRLWTGLSYANFTVKYIEVLLDKYRVCQGEIQNIRNNSDVGKEGYFDLVFKKGIVLPSESELLRKNKEHAGGGRDKNSSRDGKDRPGTKPRPPTNHNQSRNQHQNPRAENENTWNHETLGKNHQVNPKDDDLDVAEISGDDFQKQNTSGPGFMQQRTAKNPFADLTQKLFEDDTGMPDT